MKNTLTFLIILGSASCFAQVLSNGTGEVVNVSTGAVISGGGITNKGTLSNSGTVAIASGLTNSGTLKGNGNYTIAGNWLNSGIFTAGTGTVNFNGSSLQTIGGASSTRFSNVTLSGTGGVSLSTNGSFTGVLTLNNSGSFTGLATDTLISTSLSTARVAQVTGTGTIISNFVVQRYDGRGTAQYQSLSSPVKTTTLGDWNTSNRSPNFYMSGVGGPDGNAGSYVSVKIYNETSNNYDDVTSYTSPGINYNLKQGQGLYLWMGTSLYTMSPFTYITHGVPTVGNVNYNVTYTVGKGYGFNIIGNPYPSPISWTSFIASNPSIQTTFYVFQQDGSWHTFTSGSIPMEQGIGIVTTSTTPVIFKESHKSNMDASLLRIGDPGKENNAVTFTLSDDANSLSCPTIISFGKDYSPAYSYTEDALFIDSYVNEAPQLFTYSDNTKRMALNRLPDDSTVINIPLTAEENVNANYTLKATNLENLSSYNCVLLIDNATGEVVNNFLDIPSYTFSPESAPHKKEFTLRFSKIGAGQDCMPVTTSSNNDVSIYAAVQHNAVVSFNCDHTQLVTISAYNELGQKVYGNANYEVQNEKIHIALPQVNGLYIVKVQSANINISKKITITE